MKYTDNAVNIIVTKTYYKGIGNSWINKNLPEKKNIEEIINLLKQDKKISSNNSITLENFELQRKEIESRIENLGESCDGVIALGDDDFPETRGDVKDSEKPIVIFYKGNLDLLHKDNHNIAVIGLLDPHENIVERERKLVDELVENNITVVSGLAYGCDSIAHRQTLEKGGHTIAILPSPLNDILPSGNKDLAYEIVDNGGLLVTEYLENHKDFMELSGRYQDRDRLQALYSDAVFLAASYAKNSAQIRGIVGKKLDSGARLAMGFADSYGITRAIMYDPNTDEDDAMFDLNRELRQKGAITLTKKSLEEILKNIKRKDSLHKPSQMNLFNG